MKFLNEEIITSDNWQNLYKLIAFNLEEIEEVFINKGLGEKQVSPLIPNLLNILNFISPEKVKVIIITAEPVKGSDNKGIPYDEGKGCSSQVITKFSKGLFKELSREIKGFKHPSTCDLTPWIEQGVLTINSNLLSFPTLNKISYPDVWRFIITCIIREVTKCNPTCILVVWGGKELNHYSRIFTKNKLFQTNAPDHFNNDFAESNVFNEINLELIKYKEKPIDWRLVKDSTSS